MAAPMYPRVLLKISGEALAGDRGLGFDFSTIDKIADEIQSVVATGCSLGLVIGGGNIVRGSQLSKMGLDRVSADYMGMLGTVINALAVQDILERKGMATRVMTAIRMEELAEPYIRRRALAHLEKGVVVIFAAGTGNPYFSTDTAAALRAIQIKANVIIKATSVDGVYSADPKQDPNATFYDEISYRDVMLEELKVMDQTAVTLCKENALPLIVLNTGSFDERDPAVLAMLRLAIRACRKQGKYVGICGQGPSDHLDFARWLMDEGIDSLSLNPDTVVSTWMSLAEKIAVPNGAAHRVAG